MACCSFVARWLLAALVVMTCSPALAADGAALFGEKCASCHKPGGQGDMAHLNAAGRPAIFAGALGAVAQMTTIVWNADATEKAKDIAAIQDHLNTLVPALDGGPVAFGKSRTIELPQGQLVLGAQVSKFDTLERTADATNGSVTIAKDDGGKWTATYVHSGTTAGADSFKYAAKKGALTSTDRSVDLVVAQAEAPTVQSLSDVPVALNAEGAPITVNVTGGFKNRITAFSALCDGIKWTDKKLRGKGELKLVTPALNVQMTGETATFRYTPPRDGFGTDSCTYTAASISDNANTGTITVKVPPAQATVASTSLTVALNTPTTIDLRPFIGGSEISGIRLARAPSHGKASLNGTALTYTPRHNYFGSDELAFTAFGVVGESVATATLALQVSGRPNPAQDADVMALAAAQAGAAERLAWSQIEHVQQRLARLHRSAGAGSGSRPGTTGSGTTSAGTTSPGTTSAGTTSAGGTTAAARLSVAALQTAAAATSAATFAPAALHTAQAPLIAAATASADALPSTAADVLLRLAQAAQSPTLDLGAAATSADSGFWLAGEVALGARDAGTGGSRVRLRSDTATAGFDRRVDPRLALGVGIGVAHERGDIGTLGSTHRAHGESLALYASVAPRERLFVDALLGHGRLRLASRRVVEPIDDVASASRRGSVWFGAVTLGYEHDAAPWLIAPYGRFDMARQRLNATSESGAGSYALRWLPHSATQHRVALGLRVESAHDTPFGHATPWLRAESQHELKRAPGARVAYLDEPGMPVYTLAGARSDRNALQLGAGLELVTVAGLAFGAEYQVQLAGGQTRSQALRLQARHAWGGAGAAAAAPTVTAAIANAATGARDGPPLDLDVALGLTWDDNITRGKDGADRIADLLGRASVGYTRVFELSPTWQAQLRGALGAESARRHSALGRTIVDLQGELRYRASGAFLAPTWTVFVDGGYDDYRSALRDGARLGAGAAVRMAATDRIDVGASLAHNERYGRSDVFRLKDDSLRLNLDWRWGERTLLYGATEWRWGDIVSTGRDALENLDLAEVFVADDAFPDRDVQSYRFRARTTLLRLGANWRLGEASALDLSWSWVGARPQDRIGIAGLDTPRYTARQLGLVYLVRY